MKIALGQIDVKWEDKKENIRKCKEFVNKASHKKCDMVIFPEMTLTGFSMNTKDISENSNGYVMTEFKKMALDNNISIGFGYSRIIGGKFYNEMSVLSKDGIILEEYDKIHPFSYDKEDRFYEKGNKISSFSIDGINFGMFICYDLRFPEVFQISSKRNQVIILIANWPSSRIDAFDILLKARAIENQCYIVAVNRVGKSNGLYYNGYSKIIDPMGKVITNESTKEELIIGEIALDTINKVREDFPFRKDRREDIY